MEERVVAGGIAGVILLAPLPFGAVEPWASGLFAGAALMLGAIWGVCRRRAGETALPWREPLLVAGAAFLLYALAQTLPLPRPLAGWLSPESLALSEAFAPGGAGWIALSVHPAATWRAALRFAACVAVALTAADLFSRPRARAILVGALVAGGAFQAVYGLAEFISGRQQIFLYVKRHYTDVATGTFINRNHFAGYLEMTLPVAIAVCAVALGKVRRIPGLPSPWPARASGRALFAAVPPLLLCLVMLVAIVCSRSRMGIASAVAATVMVAATALWKGRGRGFAVAALALLAVTAIVLGRAGTAPLVDRFAQSLDALRGSYGRLEMWSQAAGVVARFPLVGVGIGAFPDAFPIYRSGGEGIGLAHAHNDYLETLAEAGSFGGALILAGLAAVLIRAARTRGRRDLVELGAAAAAGLTALAFHSLADFNLAIPANAMTCALLVGMVLAWRRPAPPVAIGFRPARATMGGARALVPAGLLATLGVAALLPVPAAAEQIFARAAAEAREPITDLEVLASAAASGSPPSPTAVDYLRGRLDAAIALHDEGLRRFPLSARGHLQRGRLIMARCAALSLSAAADAGCMEEAADALRAARRLRPMSRAVRAEADALLAPVDTIAAGGEPAAAELP